MVTPTKRGRGLIYARPSFFEGMARIFDLGGTLNVYDFGPGGAESDAEATLADWQAIGDDLRAALGDCGHLIDTPDFASWDGSLPSPTVLQQYDDVLPGSAERVMRMWDARMKDRIQAEKAVVEAGSKRAYLGLACGFIISLMMIAIGAYAIIWVNAWLGVAVIATQNMAFASLFIYVTNSRRRERERKAADADHRRD